MEEDGLPSPRQPARSAIRKMLGNAQSPPRWALPSPNQSALGPRHLCSAASSPVRPTLAHPDPPRRPGPAPAETPARPGSNGGAISLQSNLINLILSHLHCFERHYGMPPYTRTSFADKGTSSQDNLRLSLKSIGSLDILLSSFPF